MMRKLFTDIIPVLVDEVQQGQWHGEEAEEDVGQCQVSNQDVSWCFQHLEQKINFQVHIRVCRHGNVLEETTINP